MPTYILGRDQVADIPGVDNDDIKRVVIRASGSEQDITVFLATALTAGDEIRLRFCPSCQAVNIVEAITLRDPLCRSCESPMPEKPPSPARSGSKAFGDPFGDTSGHPNHTDRMRVAPKT